MDVSIFYQYIYVSSRKKNIIHQVTTMLVT